MKYFVIDFEFTSVQGMYSQPRAFFPEIIEAGLVLLDEKFEVIFENQTFVKPRFFPKLSKVIMDFTGIKQAEVDAGIEHEQLFEQMCTYVDEDTVIVAWGDSDQKVMKEICRRYKIEYNFGNCYLDLANAYKNFYGLKKCASLQNAILDNAIERDGWAHMALDDAKNTVLVLKKMMADGFEVKADPPL